MTPWTSFPTFIKISHIRYKWIVRFFAARRSQYNSIGFIIYSVILLIFARCHKTLFVEINFY